MRGIYKKKTSEYELSHEVTNEVNHKLRHKLRHKVNHKLRHKMSLKIKYIFFNSHNKMLGNLPREIIDHVAGFSDLETFLTLRLVSKTTNPEMNVVNYSQRKNYLVWKLVWIENYDIAKLKGVTDPVMIDWAIKRYVDTIEDCHDIFKIVSKYGWLSSVKFLYEMIGLILDNDIPNLEKWKIGLYEACHSGRIDVFDWIVDNLSLRSFTLNLNTEGVFNDITKSLMLYKACESGNLELVKKIINMGIIVENEMFFNVCKSGNLELVKFILDRLKSVQDLRTLIHGETFTDGMIGACNGGNIDILNFIITEIGSKPSISMIAEIFSKLTEFHMSTIKWMAGISPRCFTDPKGNLCIKKVIESDNVEILNVIYAGVSNGVVGEPVTVIREFNSCLKCEYFNSAGWIVEKFTKKLDLFKNNCCRFWKLFKTDEISANSIAFLWNIYKSKMRPMMNRIVKELCLMKYPAIEWFVTSNITVTSDTTVTCISKGSVIHMISLAAKHDNVDILRFLTQNKVDVIKELQNYVLKTRVRRWYERLIKNKNFC